MLNCDRYSRPLGNQLSAPRINRDNVFLSEEAPEGQLLLKAMDHTHCFTCGREWTRALAHIDRIKDTRLFGMFPEFQQFIGNDHRAVRQAAKKLSTLVQGVVDPIVQAIPGQWGVTPPVKKALVRLILERATFVAAKVERMIWPQFNLAGLDDEETEGDS